MIVHFTARQTELTPEIKAYCEKRLQSLKRLLRPVMEVNLIFSTEKYRHRVEIHVKAKGGSLVITEETHDLMSSLNLAFENLEKKIKKETEKWREKKRRKGRERKLFPAGTEVDTETKRIVRSRDYSVKPLAVDEAVAQFDVEGKEAFLFPVAGSEKWAVLYRRKDGHYGLIEPE